MNINRKPAFFTLSLMISFASVNAVLFTSALPEIARYFAISTIVAEHTIIWFLIGYALGQLIYSPIANRFGRKPALYLGISIQIASSLLCAISVYVNSYSMLLTARFLLAVGSGVGLKMAFTLVNEFYEPKIASQKISYLIMAFAITPGLSITLGGILTEYVGWISCFYAGALYGSFLLFLVARMPETWHQLDPNALKIKKLLNDYVMQFKDIRLISGGLVMGGASSFNYVFAALAPFLVINLSGMSSAHYGIASLIPPIGLFLGSMTSAELVKKFALNLLVKIGLSITTIGAIFMFIAVLTHATIIISLFIPMMIIFFGLCFVISNTSTIAMSRVIDKSHGSAVMNFVNIGFTTIVVLSLSYLPMKMILLPILFMVFIAVMSFLCKILMMEQSRTINPNLIRNF